MSTCDRRVKKAALAGLLHVPRIVGEVGEEGSAGAERVATFAAPCSSLPTTRPRRYWGGVILGELGESKVRWESRGPWEHSTQMVKEVHVLVLSVSKRCVLN